jgi:hypothetical protein
LAAGVLRVTPSPRSTAVFGSTIDISTFGASITSSAFPPHLTDLFRPQAGWPPLLAPDFQPLPGGLSDAERASILWALASSNAESGRQSVASKFCRFWAFCARTGSPPIPAQEARVLAFVQFLRGERSVSIRSAPQYVSAITTVHRWFAVPEFTATTPLIKRLLSSWRLAVADEEARDQPVAFPASSVITILTLAAESTTPTVLRAALVVGLDFTFFNRGDSAFPITAEDLTVDGEYLTFRETRFKRKRADTLTNRVRRFNAARLPALRSCIWIYRDLRVALSAPAPPSPFFWQLPGEARPTAALVRRIFEDAASTWPAYFPPGVTHHALRRGGATAAHAIGVPLETICFWGGWAFGSEAMFLYMDFTHEATPADFQAFGWMRTRAAEIASAYLERELDLLPTDG